MARGVSRSVHRAIITITLFAPDNELKARTSWLAGAILNPVTLELASMAS